MKEYLAGKENSEASNKAGSREYPQAPTPPPSPPAIAGSSRAFLPSVRQEDLDLGGFIYWRARVPFPRAPFLV